MQRLNQFVLEPTAKAGKYLGNQVLDMVDPNTKNAASLKEFIALASAVGLYYVPYCSLISQGLVLTVASAEGLKAVDHYSQGDVLRPLVGFFRSANHPANQAAAANAANNATPPADATPAKKAS